MVARWRNPCCGGKAMLLILSVGVVALRIQHEMRHIVVRGLSRSTVFLHIISQTAGFSGGGGNLLKRKCFLFFFTNIL